MFQPIALLKPDPRFNTDVTAASKILNRMLYYVHENVVVVAAHISSSHNLIAYNCGVVCARVWVCLCTCVCVDIHTYMCVHACVRETCRE